MQMADVILPILALSILKAEIAIAFGEPHDYTLSVLTTSSTIAYVHAETSGLTTLQLNSYIV